MSYYVTLFSIKNDTKPIEQCELNPTVLWQWALKLSQPLSFQQQESFGMKPFSSGGTRFKHHIISCWSWYPRIYSFKILMSQLHLYIEKENDTNIQKDLGSCQTNVTSNQWEIPVPYTYSIKTVIECNPGIRFRICGNLHLLIKWIESLFRTFFLWLPILYCHILLRELDLSLYL